jgi:hypothetical protein
MAFSLNVIAPRLFLAAIPAVALLGCGGADDSASTSSTASKQDPVVAATLVSSTRPQLPMPNQMAGVTIDDTSKLSATVTALKSLSKTPTTRIVFDEFVPAADYRDATVSIRNVSYVMGELLDSFYVKQYSVQQYLDRTKEYLGTLGDVVDLWEVGNEINGEWLGTNADVVAKMTGAYDLVKGQGKATALTLYYNKDCWSRASNEMFTWANNNIPARMKQGLDYVLISYYEDDCNGLQPDWPTVFHQLHQMFPNSKIGFGETGTTNTSKKAEYVTRYYTKNITEPGYVGGYFWWYFHQDMVPMTNPLWTTLNTAISKMPTFTPLQSTTPAPAPTPTPAQAPTPTPAPAADTVPTTAAAWTTQYTGYGSVTYDATAGIVLSPKVSTQASETHAALTLANLPLMRNFRASFNVVTEQQLRLYSPPNPWEVFWLFFNYNPTKYGKNTNYFILKPNGVELGTATAQNGQTFLKTGPAPAPAIGANNKIDIEKVDGRVQIWVNGILAVDQSTGLIDVDGSIGLYSEDARVRVTNVHVTKL